MAKDRLMTAGEVAEYLCCSVSTVRRFAARGTMPHYRLGNLVRFRRSDVESWLSRNQFGDVPHEARKVVVDPGQLLLFAVEGSG
jgi:excisionase family DNA binding protein